MNNNEINNTLRMGDIQKVMEIINDFARKNKLIKKQNLYQLAKKKLTLKSRAIISILNYLSNDKYFIENSKLIKGDIFLNPYREIIYKFIKEYPGITFSRLKEYVFSEYKLVNGKYLKKNRLKKGSSGQLIWHIKVLSKFNIIKKVTFKKFSLFLPYEMEVNLGILYHLLRDDVNLRIISIIKENKSILRANVPKMINLSKGVIYYHINIMKEQNLIFSEKNNRHIKIWLNPNKIELIKAIINDIKKNEDRSYLSI